MVWVWKHSVEGSGAWCTTPGTALRRSFRGHSKDWHLGKEDTRGWQSWWDTGNGWRVCPTGMTICLLSLSFKSILLCSALWCWNWVSTNYSLWLWFQCVCPLAAPTVLLGFLLPWTWGISSQLLQQSAATAPYFGRVSPHSCPSRPWTFF